MSQSIWDKVAKACIDRHIDRSDAVEQALNMWLAGVLPAPSDQLAAVDATPVEREFALAAIAFFRQERHPDKKTYSDTYTIGHIRDMLTKVGVIFEQISTDIAYMQKRRSADDTRVDEPTSGFSATERLIAAATRALADAKELDRRTREAAGIALGDDPQPGDNLRTGKGDAA